MISRVAESCFWMNRYVERVEVLARMLEVNLASQLDLDLPEAERWRPLVVVTGQEDDFLKRTDPSKVDDAEEVQEYLSWNEDNPSSIFSSLRSARENARTVRETISLEMWETLNDGWVWISGRDARRQFRSERQAFYLRLRNQCLLFHGIAQATMLHEDPFEFMRLGTALERVGQTARVLDVKHHSVGPTQDGEESAAEIAQWLSVLRFCSGVEPFLKRRTAAPSGKSVAEFLLFEEAFARSVLHNLDRTRNFLDLVRPPAPSSIGERSHALVEDTRVHLASMSIEDVLAEGLHEVLTWIVNATAEITDALREEFFDFAPQAGQSQGQRQGGQSQSQQPA